MRHDRCLLCVRSCSISGLGIDGLLLAWIQRTQCHLRVQRVVRLQPAQSCHQQRQPDRKLAGHGLQRLLVCAAALAIAGSGGTPWYSNNEHAALGARSGKPVHKLCGGDRKGDGDAAGAELSKGQVDDGHVHMHLQQGRKGGVNTPPWQATGVKL